MKLGLWEITLHGDELVGVMAFQFPEVFAYDCGWLELFTERTERRGNLESKD